MPGDTAKSIVDLRAFVRINHAYMTIQEIADELNGRHGMNVSYARVYAVYDLYKLRPHSHSDCARHYIVENPNKYIEDIASHTGLEFGTLRNLACRLGISLKSKPQGEKVKQEKPKSEKDRLRASLRKYCKVVGYKAESEKRLSEAYTQTSSPYGIATYRSGIEVGK